MKTKRKPHPCEGCGHEAKHANTVAPNGVFMVSLDTTPRKGMSIGDSHGRATTTQN